MSVRPGPGIGVNNYFDVLDNDVVLEDNKRRKIRNFLTDYSSPPKSIKDDPKFLIITSADDSKPLKSISPFAIRKWINITCDRVERISRLRDGNVLILTKNNRQANTLLALKNLGSMCKIKVSLHNSLNSCKGVVYCRDWFMLSDEEILKELESQSVIKVENITKLINGERRPTGLFIITFNAYNLPSTIDTGFHSVKVKQYIPTPLRCIKCRRIGHTKNHCDKAVICVDCADIEHKPNNCSKPVVCVNCNSNKHNSISKECEKYIENQEILRIKTEERCSMRWAKQKFFKSKPKEGPSPTLKYSEILKNSPPTTITNEIQNSIDNSLKQKPQPANNQNKENSTEKINSKNINTNIETNQKTNTNNINNLIQKQNETLNLTYPNISSPTISLSEDEIME